MDTRKQTRVRDLRQQEMSSSTVFDLHEVLRPIEAQPAVPEDRIIGMSRIFWESRRRIARIALVVALISLVITVFVPNSYVSSTKLMPPEKGSSGMAALASMAFGMKSMAGGGASSGGGASEIGSMAGDLLGIQSSGALVVGVLQSRSAQDKLVSQFDLQSVYGHPWLRWKVSRENAQKELENNTEIVEDRKSGIITVKVSDHDPQRAAGLARAYVDQLNDLMSHLNTSSAGREREFLEKELVKVKKDLDDADQQLSQFSSKHATLDPREQGKAMMQAASQLQGELIAAESSLRGLQAIYTDNNVRVRTLRARIAELRKQLGNVSGGGVDDGSGTPSEGTTSDFGLPSIRQLPLLGVTYADLYRRAKIQETVYQVLTQQYETAKVQEAKELPSIRVLDPALVPERKSGPHRLLIALLAGILGGLLGCAWTLGNDRYQKTADSDPYKSLFTDVATTFQSTRLWKQGESGAKRVYEISKARFPKYFSNGSSHNGTSPHSESLDEPSNQTDNR